MTFSFHEEAEAELDREVAYYDRPTRRLGIAPSLV